MHPHGRHAGPLFHVENARRLTSVSEVAKEALQVGPADRISMHANTFFMSSNQNVHIGSPYRTVFSAFHNKNLTFKQSLVHEGHWCNLKCDQT